MISHPGTLFSAVVVLLCVTVRPADAQQSISEVLSFLVTNRSIATDDFVRDEQAASATRDTISRFLVLELATLPITSAGGFTYRLDPTLGTVIRSSDSFGPFFTERSLTTGTRQAALAAALRVLVERHAGGALDRGERVASFEGGPGAIELAPEQAAALAPGHYTWEAWALVDGLDVHLGRRDFEVVRDAQLTARLAELERLEEPDRSEALIALLHERGFLGDARALARDLPATPERDAYLRALPGR
jgi:hypothetical protein